MYNDYLNYINGNVADNGTVEQQAVIGEHVRHEFSYGRCLKPRETPFEEFGPEDLLMEPLCEEEVFEMQGHGIKVSQAYITRGEWDLMDDERLNVHRCKPSGLRKVWSIVQ